MSGTGSIAAMRQVRATIVLGGMAALLLYLGNERAGAQAEAGQAAGASARVVGTIKAMAGNSITLISDEGGTSFRVTVGDATRIVRVAPGEKNLKNAVAVRLTDLQAGDRILVRGKPSQDSSALDATAIVVMKQTDVAAAREQEREEWQKHGVGGVVTAVDEASGTITLSVGAFGAKPTVAVHTTKDTILRRYAPDSAKFDEARPAALDQIQPGDQLRVRGTRSTDGSEIAATEAVSGTFRNIAGTVTQVDAAGNTLTVQDAISKKPVVVKFSSESQLRKLPEEVAQRIAMRLKGNGERAEQGSSPANHGESRPQPSGGAAGMGGGRTPDLQQILSRMPAASLTDLQKGDVVMLVSTQGNGAGEVTAITVLAGVDAILRASPNGPSSMLLSPWSLGSPSLEGAGP